MSETLRYNLNAEGTAVEDIGFIESYDIAITDEPFDLNNFFLFERNPETGEWTEKIFD